MVSEKSTLSGKMLALRPRLSVFVLVAALLGCSDSSGDVDAKERAEINDAIKEVICRENNRSYAFSEIVEFVEENPQAGISVQVFGSVQDIDDTGCSAIIADKQNEWVRSDARIQERYETFQKMKREGKFDKAEKKTPE